MKEIAIALDLDGVVVGRPMPHLFSVARKLLPSSSVFDPKLLDISLKHLPSSSIAEGPLGRVLLEMVKRRKVSPKVRGQIATIAKTSIDIYGNTARPNTSPWVSATLKTLRDGEVLPYFKDVFFKPEGVPSEVGKIANVRELLKRYNQVTVVEDNPVEGLAIARAFPSRVKVYIVQSLTAGVLFSREEMLKVPNARRVASLGNLVSREILAI